MPRRNDKLHQLTRRSAGGVDVVFVWARDPEEAFRVFVNKTAFEPTQRPRVTIEQVADPATIDPAAILNPGKSAR